MTATCSYATMTDMCSCVTMTATCSYVTMTATCNCVTMNATCSDIRGAKAQTVTYMTSSIYISKVTPELVWGPITVKPWFPSALHLTAVFLKPYKLYSPSIFCFYLPV